MSFNWTQLIPGVGHENAHVATLALTSVACVGVGLYAKSQLGSGAKATVPSGKFSVRALFEMNAEFMSGLCDSVIGKTGRTYAPFFSALFFFILVNNLVGIIPGMTPATENLNTTIAFGIFSFLTYNFLGLKENGWSYLAHFAGPVIWLAPLMVVIELVSHFIRPITLGLRLANVMTGDHTVLSVFLDLVPFGVPIPFYVMGLLVCFIQAFVFTLLSMVYVALATAHDH